MAMPLKDDDKNHFKLLGAVAAAKKTSLARSSRYTFFFLAAASKGWRCCIVPMLRTL
jgi:hypothetical protein